MASINRVTCSRFLYHKHNLTNPFIFMGRFRTYLLTSCRDSLGTTLTWTCYNLWKPLLLRFLLFMNHRLIVDPDYQLYTTTVSRFRPGVVTTATVCGLHLTIIGGPIVIAITPGTIRLISISFGRPQHHRICEFRQVLGLWNDTFYFSIQCEMNH